MMIDFISGIMKSPGPTLTPQPTERLAVAGCRCYWRGLKHCPPYATHHFHKRHHKADQCQNIACICLAIHCSSMIGWIWLPGTPCVDISAEPFRQTLVLCRSLSAIHTQLFQSRQSETDAFFWFFKFRMPAALWTPQEKAILDFWVMPTILEFNT